jgi:HPt (histidine-containing phosphotransfer) domain-containing protein
MNETVNSNSHLLVSNDVTVDISMLYDVAGNDEACIKMMADTFLQTVPVYVKNINESFGKEDYEGLYQSAHKTKSTLSIVKINNMLEWVKEIEQYAKQSTKSEALAELVQKVTNRFSIAMQLLKEKFAP